jgi:hypothetical protein
MEDLATLFRAFLFCCLLTAPASAGEGKPAAPKLEELDGAVRDGGPVLHEEKVETIPKTATICMDAADRVCWSEAGEADCRSPHHPAGEIFRRLENREEGRSLGDALKACWQRFAE